MLFTYPDLMQFLKKNWFVLAMLAVLAAAFAAPGAGAYLNAGKFAGTAAVVLVFFLSGFSLPSAAIVKGLREVRLHLFIHVFIFGISPLYFALTAWPFRDVMDGHLIAGIYALACLPTTISSCIVFTQLAGGNVAGTIFNASLSNLLGVFISPLLLTVLLRGGGDALPFGQVVDIFVKLLVRVLLPFVVGQGFYALFRDFSARHKKTSSVLSGCLVLVIVYLAFCGAAGNRALMGQVRRLAWPFAYLAGSNVLMVLLAYAGARLVGLNRENTISALFCAPQKTLAMGAPLLAAYFADSPELLGIAILPVLFYHPWQLFVAGLVNNSRLVRAG
ncbi:MAG: bile acid:sodium symporter [Kiritimatiellae bacterium]|nr:bile acid:sodium symporter [Kiritimatiellia bacterium]